MTSRAAPTILERILDGREPLLDLMSEYRAAIEAEVRDDIAVRVLALPVINEPPHAATGLLSRMSVLTAISSSSATETPEWERPYFADGSSLADSPSGIHQDTVMRMKEKARRPSATETQDGERPDHE